MDEIARTVERLRVAMIDADRIQLECLTTDELSYGHTSGLIENKREFIDALVGTDRRDVFKWIELTEHVITVLGGVAIARHRFCAEVLVNGVLIAPDIHVLQVFVQAQQGEWKLLARQAYRF